MDWTDYRGKKDWTVYDELVEFLENGELIRGVVFGFNDAYDDAKIPDEKIGVVLSWEEAAPLLRQMEWYHLQGDVRHPVWVWTNRRVIFPVVYDGQFWLGSVPRNPRCCSPQFLGGGK